MQMPLESLLSPGEKLLWFGLPAPESRFARFERNFFVGGWAMLAVGVFLTLQFWVVSNPSYWGGNRAGLAAVTAPMIVVVVGLTCLFPRSFRWKLLKDRAYAITDRRAVVVDLKTGQISQFWRLAGIPSPKVEPSAILFEPRTAGRLHTAPGFVGLLDSTEPAEIIAQVQNDAGETNT